MDLHLRKINPTQKLRAGHHTGLFGKKLVERLRNSNAHKDRHVFYDHGDKQQDANVSAIMGFHGDKVANVNRLADVDILVATSSQTVEVIIEIEERKCSPKYIAGDVFAIMMCSRFAVKQHRLHTYFEVDQFTKLVITGVVPDDGHRLRKIDEVMSSRMQELGGFDGGILPKNVTLIFENTIERAIIRLEQDLGYFEQTP